MKFVLITRDTSIIEAAKTAYGTHYALLVFDDWRAALDASGDADLMFVDLIATLKDEGKIEGYEDFALTKMAHPDAKPIPLVLIAPPDDYELDAMVGWPDFVFRMVRRPVEARMFRQASGWV